MPPNVVFSRFGFAGGSMREISAEAEVAQALLHYHFKNKDSLYRQVFQRRSAVIVAHRGDQLKELFDSDQVPTLENVLAIIATPLPLIFGDAGQDSRYYLQMVAEVTVATDDRSGRDRQHFLRPDRQGYGCGAHTRLAGSVAGAGQLGLSVRHRRTPPGTRP